MRPLERFPAERPAIIDPKKENELRAKALVEVETSPIAQEALKMGFDRVQVTKAVMIRLNDYGRGFAKVATLVNELLSEPAESSEMLSSDEETEPLKEKDPREEWHQLITKMHCRLCKEKKAMTLLLPCGHLCVCEECAAQADKCPTCGMRVKERVRTFRA